MSAHSVPAPSPNDRWAAIGEHADLITAALAGLLALMAVLLGVFAPSTPSFAVGVPAWLVTAILVVAFFLGEQMLMNVEFRRQAHSMTLAGLPLVIGVLVLPVPLVIVARVAGSLAALLVQRVSLDKTAYNLAAWAFEAAVDAILIDLLVGRTHLLSVADVGTVLAIVVLVDQAMSCLVLMVIRAHGGTVDLSSARDVLVPALVLATVSTAMSVGMLLLMSLGALGTGIVLVVAFVMLALYRGYLSATHRHERLEMMHQFVTDDPEAQSFAAVTAVLLSRIRGLLRAETVTLALVPGDLDDLVGLDGSPAATRYVDDADDGFTLGFEAQTPDWITVRALEQGEPSVIARSTKDRAERTWLRQQGYRDAVVIPLPAGSGLAGTLTVSDRLGETSTFAADDVTLLQTLVGHLVVAGRSAQLVERLAYDATHDPLTGLVNRAELARRIEDALAARRPSACLLLDLDRFKEVNDGLGHAAGDKLLQVVAGRLVDHLPADSVVARLGGDEFAILLPMPDGEQGVQTLCAELADAVASPVLLDAAMLTPDASVGIAPASLDVTAGELLRRADVAMYAAKAQGHPVAVYHRDLDRDRAEDLALIADLRNALREAPGQFDLYYQPKLALDSRTVVGAEALIRWNHPTRGIVGPDRFVPLAERAGLIQQLAPIVLEKALTECRRWSRAGHELSVAVNLSARDVGDPGLPDRVAAALTRAGVPASNLILEITESSIIADPQQTLGVLDRLAALGVTISLDDFGTGYSSLSYLQRLPVQEVKIDRSFVQGLESRDSRSSNALITSITSLGKNLGLRVVAEGAESMHQMDELQALGCGVVQGYCISRPIPASAFLVWLDRTEWTQTPPTLSLVAPTGTD